MPGQPIDLGPFVGGINNATDDSTIEDTDLIEAINWLVGIDGTLIGRPPFYEWDDDNPVTDKRLKLLGYTTLHASSAFTPVLIASNEDGTWAYYSGAWDKISDNEYDTFVTYGETNNRVHIAATTSEQGGDWVIADGAISEYSDMPIGWTSAVHKDRIWIAGNLAEPSRLYYSMATPQGNNGDWDIAGPTAPAGTIDINPGDGQRINYILSYEDNLVIFKDDSTWILAYDGVISRGQLVAVSNSIGATDKHAVTLYDGVAYVYHEGNIYAFSQNQFQSITDKFTPDGDSAVASSYSEPLSLSVFGDNLVLRQYDKVYVYHFLTGAWTEWQTEFPVGEFVLVPTNIGIGGSEYIVASADLDTIELFKINTTWNDVATEDFECSILTKTYDFGTDRNFKRLFWWGIDCEASSGDVTAEVTPINNDFILRWDDLTGLWSDYETRTWDTLMSSQPSIEDGPTSSSSNKRRFYKCLKALRFHQIKFRVTITSDGTESSGRVKLFAIVPFVGIKQGVVAKIT